MMRAVAVILFLTFTTFVQARSWQDLWLTKDQQAQRLMAKGQYQKAQKQFDNPMWQATAAYRAGDYQVAADGFSSKQSPDGYYNLGNSLAHMGQYEKAIEAYNKAIELKPNMADAIHNRRLIQALVDEEKKQSSKPSNAAKDDKRQSSDSSSSQSKQTKTADNNQQKHRRARQEKTPRAEHNHADETRKNAAQDQTRHPDTKTSPAKKQTDTSKTPNQSQLAQTRRQEEANNAKKQWLRLIPDDPGGLLRQKFLRDHMRRRYGW